MGAGFGHTYTVYNKSYSALAFSLEGRDVFELAAESANEANTDIENPEDHSTIEAAMERICEDLCGSLETLKTITATFKGRTFDSEVGVESTYNGDDLCLVPRNLWDAYAEVIENETQEYNAINWAGVAKHEDALKVAFELALCEAVFKEYPHMWVRKRIHGWCGTTYKPVADYILDLKKQ